MQSDSNLLRVAAVAACLTAATTLGIHLLPELSLRTNQAYLGRLFIVIIHCVLVVVSMYGARALARRSSTALADLGFLAFVMFAYAEIVRTSLGIFALNWTWRAAHIAAEDSGAGDRARFLIEGFAGINEALYFLAFFLGTFCYGLAFRRTAGPTGWIGWLLLVWAGLTLPGLLDTIAGTDTMSHYFAWVGPFFQAPARALIGVWLWKSS